jgi:hypothetical protein
METALAGLDAQGLQLLTSGKAEPLVLYDLNVAKPSYKIL